MLILSDGETTAVRYTKTEIRSAAREGDVQIYAMGVEEPIYTRRLLADVPVHTGSEVTFAVGISSSYTVSSVLSTF